MRPHVMHVLVDQNFVAQNFQIGLRMCKISGDGETGFFQMQTSMHREKSIYAWGACSPQSQASF